jgi:hypothetical protein
VGGKRRGRVAAGLFRRIPLGGGFVHYVLRRPNDGLAGASLHHPAQLVLGGGMRLRGGGPSRFGRAFGLLRGLKSLGLGGDIVLFLADRGFARGQGGGQFAALGSTRTDQEILDRPDHPNPAMMALAAGPSLQGQGIDGVERRRGRRDAPDHVDQLVPAVAQPRFAHDVLALAG